MENEYTTEESDNLLLADMWLAEENSIINNEEVEVETESETEEENTSKSKQWIAKVLHQRNEARKEAETYKSEVESLKEELAKLEEEGNYGTEEYIQTLVDKRLAEGREKQDFFDNKYYLKEYKKEILDYSKETWLSLEKATKLYLAENNPELLLDNETLNKKQSKFYQTPSVTPRNLWVKEVKYSLNEFEEMVKKGMVKF